MAVSYAVLASINDDDVDEESYRRPRFELPQCTVERCYDQEYADGLCKNHHDLEWYRKGMPRVSWRTVTACRSCRACGAPMINPHPRAQYCSKKCGVLARTRKYRGLSIKGEKEVGHSEGMAFTHTAKHVPY